MPLPELNFQQASDVLKDHFSEEWAPTNASSARAVIESYHRKGGDDLLPRSLMKLIPVYWALQILSCSGMDGHRADPKRYDRRFGQKLRLNRTGSRSG